MRHWVAGRVFAGVGLVAFLVGVLPAVGAQAIGQVGAASAGSGSAGTNIGNAGQLTGGASGSLASSASDDWWVAYPATAGEPVAVTVTNTTPASQSCGELTASLDATDGAADPLKAVTLSHGASQTLSDSRTGSDRYFVEVRAAGCDPASGEPVKYTLSLDSGGGGTAPSPADGSIAAGTSIGSAWPPLQGKTSYTGTIASGSSDDWYVLYKKPDTNPATIRVEDTTDAGTVVCPEVTVSLDAEDGSSDPIAAVTLSDNGATTFAVPAETGTDPAGLYYLEVNSPSCTLGGISYRVEPEPAGEWQNPARLPAGKAAPGSSIGNAGPPLAGGTTYDGSISGGSAENWYVLYKEPGTSPASVRVEDTTVANTTSCPEVTATLDGADGAADPLSAQTLGGNGATTLDIPDPGGPDYQGRYFLEIDDFGCPSGMATYRIEPEPRTGWANPAKPASKPLPSGPDEKAAGGPLTGGITYDAALSNATSQDWVFFEATGSTTLTVSVQNTTSSLDNCHEEAVSLLDSSGVVDSATLSDEGGAELVVDTAQTFYIEISVAGNCAPSMPLTATVTLTPPSGVCTCGCAAAPDREARPASASPLEIQMHKPGGGAITVTGKTKTTTVGVGEPIDLSLACAKNGTPTGPFKWKLPNGSGYPVTLSKYEIDDNEDKSTTTLVKLTMFTKKTLSFYWLKPGAYTVTATATVNGAPAQAWTSFNVVAPQAEFTAKTCQAGLNTLWTFHLPGGNAGPPRLSLGLNNDCVKAPGLTWSAKVDQKGRPLPEADLAVVQLTKGTLTHSTSKNACVDTKGKWYADNHAFYITGTFEPKINGHQVTGFKAGDNMVLVKAGMSKEFTSLDAPSVPLKNGGTFTENFDFTDYLMYRPNYKATGLGHFGIWVALRHLSWTFHASATFDTKTHHWALGKVTDPNKKDIGSTESSTEPQFTKVATNGNCP